MNSKLWKRTLSGVACTLALVGLVDRASADPSCGHDDPMPYIRISAFKDDVPVAWTTFYVPGSTPMMT